MGFRPLLLTIFLFLGVHAQAAEIEFSAATYTVAENVSPLVITVTRTGDTTGAASVTITSADIGASAGFDYTAISSTLSWNAGDATARTVNMTILDDALLEGEETLRLTLSGESGDTLGAIDTAIITITDYEEGEISLTAESYDISEDVGTAAITVQRTSGTSGEAQVNYATTAGTATSPDRFTATSGTLVFADGVSSQTINIPIIDNEIGELDTAFTVTISLATGASLGDQVTATVNIINDDADYTGGLTLISPTVTDITQSSVVNLSQESPLLSGDTLLETMNRVPVLLSTELEVTQVVASGLAELIVGDVSAHFYPYRVIRLDAIEDAEVYIAQDSSGRFVTDEGLQIEFEPALASISTLQTFLSDLGIPELSITPYGNITVQGNQGPPPFELDDEGKVYINNSYYDRYNLRPSLTSYVLDPNIETDTGVYLLEHLSIPGGVYLSVVYTAGGETRFQNLSTAPTISSEFLAGLSGLNGVSNIRMRDDGTTTFMFNGRSMTMYADFVVRRVDPATYADSFATGLFGAGDLNADGTADFKMVYSTGDEQYFFFFES
ncbi:MAG: Calx-beta domain-containing protein [Pseudohongiellaceae bacterium]|nr:Calx-beta domain-containing protein [Pseudohongiellaceae bacterium]